jgi:hypothetical protein
MPQPVILCAQLLRQICLAQAICKLFSICGFSKRQSTEMINIRVSRIDLLELAPDLARLLDRPKWPNADARNARDKSVVGFIAIRSFNTATAAS